MTNHFIQTRTILLIMLCLATLTASAAKTTIDDIVYSCNTQNMKASVQGFADYTTNNTKLKIPDKITYKNKTYKVTSIANDAFAGEALKTATLGKYIETIGTSAFSGTSLKSINFPSHLKIIGRGAFSSCLLTNVELPASLEIIRAYAFHNCRKLETVRFNGNNLTEIGEEAFSWCPLLYSMNMPASVKSIGAGLCDLCESLKNVTLSPALTSIPERAFDMCPVEYLIIPPSVTQIGEAAFCGHATQYLMIPSSVKSIGESAFELGSGPYVVLNEGLVSIGRRAFAASAITAVTLPQSAVNLGEAIFDQCHSLEQAFLPGNMKVIPPKMFRKTGLRSITLPEGLTEIGDEAFCNSSFFVDYALPSSLRVIGNRAFYNTDTVDNLILNEGLQKIGTRPFGYCKNSVLDIPASVTEIGKEAFITFTNLKHVVAHPVVPPALGADAFSGGTYTHVDLIVPEGSHQLYASAPEWQRFKNLSIPTGIADITDNTSTSPRYFDLTGSEVSDPVKGEIYIRIKGDKSSKIVF